MGIISSPEAGVALVVEGAVVDAEVPDKGPDLSIVPVYDGVDAHEVGPAVIGLVEVGEGGAMGVSAPGADEDGADLGVEVEVGGEGGADCFCGRSGYAAGQGEVVEAGGRFDEGFDGGERVRGLGVDCGDGFRVGFECWGCSWGIGRRF